MVWAGLWLSMAHAEVPLPSFRDALAREAWNQLDAQLEGGCAFRPDAGGVVCREGVTDAVIERARRFRSQVFEDPGLAYLQGLAHRYAGQEAKARRAWEQALAQDPDYRAAWYDLGELHLVAGRFEEARAAFSRVADLADDSPAPWIGHQRLAEVAALQHDAAAFETHVKQALERGFSFRQVVDWPNWQAFGTDPALRDTYDKLLTVYTTDEVRQQLLGQDPEPTQPR